MSNFNFEPFVCKNGEIVYLSSDTNDGNKVYVYYKGKKFVRSRDIIGKTIFSTQKIQIAVGATVIVSDMKTNEVFTALITPTKEKRVYQRGGGAYYGAQVTVNYVFDYENIPENDDILNISPFSPFGKAILGKYVGEYFSYQTPDAITQRIKILGASI